MSGSNPQITSQDVVQGAILWLPPKLRTVEVLESHGLASHQPITNLTWKNNVPEDAFYDHPILVVSRPANKTNRIHFVPLTTFRGTDLRNRFDLYLAMAPAPLHPRFLEGDEVYRTLSLQNNDFMHKPGYAKIQCVYSTDWRATEHYWGGNRPAANTARLDYASLGTLLRGVKKIAKGYTPAMQYQPVKLAVPVALANPSGPSFTLPHPSYEQQFRVPSRPPKTITSPCNIPQVSNIQPRTPTAQHPPPVYWNEEQRPLLPRYRRPNRAPKQNDPGMSFIEWLRFCLGKAWIWIVRAVCGASVTVRD